jgi:RNA polymerase sigma factor (sigma-70 family)
MSEELRQSMMCALQSMPNRLRDVYLLHEIEDLSYQAIAERLDLTYHAVQKRFTRALEYLHVTVQTYYDRPN